MKCEAQLSEIFKRMIKEYREPNCKRKPLYKINGKCYCGNHASLELLKQAVENKTIEIIK